MLWLSGTRKKKEGYEEEEEAAECLVSKGAGGAVELDTYK